MCIRSSQDLSNGTFRCSAQLPETMSIDSSAPEHPAHPDNWESMYTLEVVAEVRRLVRQGKEKGGRIVICKTIAEAFLAAGIAWYDDALPDHVGISVWNRSKFSGSWGTTSTPTWATSLT